MMGLSPESRALLRIKQRSCFFLGLTLLGVVAAYRGLSENFKPVLASMLLAWSASFLLFGVMVGRGWIPLKWLPAFTVPIGYTEFITLIQFTGGPHSPFFPILGALPVVIAIFTPYTRVITLLSNVTALSTVMALGVLAKMPPLDLAMQLSCFVIIAGLSQLGVETYHRMSAAEKAAQHERMLALGQLSQSERRRMHAERERSEMERLALVGQLASGVAHEVNNPLAFVKSNLHFLKEELQREDTPRDQEEIRQVIDETQQGVLRIQRIITDLRSFSREGQDLGSGGWPESAVREAQRLASVRMHGLGEVLLDIPPGLPSVRLGQSHLVQVLVNLLLNAADAVESAVPARRARILVTAYRLTDSVRLEVEDNGPGIPEPLLERIFEPFFTTRQTGQGTGLGLALCREYVSRAGGTLQAENRSEGGARFTLVLPGGSEPSVDMDHTPARAMAAPLQALDGPPAEELGAPPSPGRRLVVEPSDPQ